jgi:methylglutaconyl-CoA hydratase
MTIRTKISPPSATIILDRPKQRNAIDRQMVRQLSQALEDIGQEKRIRAVILTGAGSDFCAGLDLKELLATRQQGEAEALHQLQQDWQALAELIEQMLRYPKVLIAALDGAVLGTGLALVAACDLVVASDRARLGVPTVFRGIVSGLLAPLLTFRCGAAVSAPWLLLGDFHSASTAHRVGLVHELVPPDQIWVRSHQLAQQIDAAPRESIQITKRLINEIVGESVISNIMVGAAMSASACTTEAALEGLQAFAEKRSPSPGSRA